MGDMRYISLFSGIEAATVAWEPLGWEPVCFAELDPFPCAVLEHRYPDVPNVGDVTKVNWKKFKGKCDVVVGGSPCQSFSVAGKREGLSGESGLMFEYIRAVREVRPRWFLWENVPGALSSEGGEAFRQLLSEMDKLGYGLAWRILDAQFFGVAQRRRRVFLVGRLGACPPIGVLIEPESMRGDLESSAEKRESLAEEAGRSPRSAGFKYHQGAGAGGVGAEPEQSPTLTADWHNPAVYPINEQIATRDKKLNRICNLQLLIAEENSRKAADDGRYLSGEDNPRSKITAEVRSRIAHDYRTSGMTYRELAQKYGVSKSRIGQIVNECDWTKIPYRGKPAEECPDGPRYKAIGNSFAVPVVRWIGERIAMADKEDE